MARERNEICKARKDSGLSCNGCQYTEGCEILKKEAEELPEDIKPGTKQAKIYKLLKEGKKAAEIIKTKEFASESVYIVARKHFPDALAKPQKKEDERMRKALEIVKEMYNTEQPLPEMEINPKITALEQALKEGPKWKKRCEVLLESLKKAQATLEDGEIVETYKQMQQMIEFLEAVK